MTYSVSPTDTVKRNLITSLTIKLRDHILSLNRYKSLKEDSESKSCSNFAFMESEVVEADCRSSRARNLSHCKNRRT